MSEKRPIRNGIIVCVVSGLILAVLLSSWLQGRLVGCLHWCWNVFIFLGALLVRPLEIPVWILALLSALSLFPILLAVRAFRRKVNDSSQYTCDNLFGVIWRWRYALGHINNLCPYCPRCDLELVYHEQRNDYHQPSPLFPPEFTEFVCENCKIKSGKLPGDKYDAVGRVEREIRRRPRTGEWKRTLRTEQ